jgi:hypothetical protein
LQEHGIRMGVAGSRMVVRRLVCALMLLGGVASCTFLTSLDGLSGAPEGLPGKVDGGHATIDGGPAQTVTPPASTGRTPSW